MPQRASTSAGGFRFSGAPAMRRRRRFSRHIVTLAAVSLLAAAGLLTIAATGLRIPSDIGAYDRTAVSLGFGITRLDISGNRYTRRSDVVSALGLASGASQLAFDTSAAEARIEALPWVLKAGIHRSLPDGLVVEITERRPAIVWRAPDRDLLLDMDGRELSTLPRGADLGLPVVTGEAAGPAAPGFMALLEQHAEIQRRTVEARRIEGRRWTLLLKEGTLVHLPAIGVAGSLAWLESRAADGLLELGLEAIDLRVTGQLVVRKRDAPASELIARARHSAHGAIAGGGEP